MRTMKAARFFGPRDMRTVEIPLPELGPHDVLCKVVRSGICGTDYAIYSGEFSFVKNGAVKFPMTPGHEWSGVVEAIGTEVTRFRIGDRVVGDTCVSCGWCGHCLMGEYFLCHKMRAVGTINAWDGAHAECIAMPERHLFHLPDTVSFDQGAMVEPAATALYAVHRAEVGPGDSVLVHGTGPIGIMAAKMAKLSGAARVLITGRKVFKLKAALAFGADVTIDTTAHAFGDVVRHEVGAEGVDKIVEASGSTQLLHESLDVIKPDGIISAVAFYERPVERFNIDKLVFGGISLRGVAGSLGMYGPILQFMKAGMFDPTPLITGRYAFHDIHQAMRDMQERNESRIKLMLEM